MHEYFTDVQWRLYMWFYEPFPNLLGWQNAHYSLTQKYKETYIILQSIGIIVIKSKETSAFIYTCRYSSGHFNSYNGD